MNISEPFIKRPVATSLLMVGVLLMGLLGYYLLPISALPPVDFPTIQTADLVKALFPKLRAALPPSVKPSIFGDRTETIRASVADVQFTLLLTVALVVM